MDTERERNLKSSSSASSTTKIIVKQGQRRNEKQEEQQIDELLEEEFIEVEHLDIADNINFPELLGIGNDVIVDGGFGGGLDGEDQEYLDQEYANAKQLYERQCQQIAANKPPPPADGERKMLFTSRRIKQGLENNEYYRVPLVKGNTKYAMYYDRLIHVDGTSTEHYICKNYEKCGKIFHRRYLDALCEHMNQCRSENLWHKEECNGNTIKNLMVKIVIREPSALNVIYSKAYMEHIEELSRIMVMRYSIGETIGKDALPRQRDFHKEVAKYCMEDEQRVLPLVIREMVSSGCAIEFFITPDEPAYHIVFSTYINNAWNLSRTLLKYDKCLEGKEPLNPLSLFNTFLTQYTVKLSPSDKLYFTSEFEDTENPDIHQTCILHLLEGLVSQLLFSISNGAGVNAKVQKLRQLLRQLRDFEEEARRHFNLRKFFTSNLNSSSRLQVIALARNWLICFEEISAILEQSRSTKFDALRAEFSSLSREENAQLLRSYVAILEPFEEAMEIFQSTNTQPTFNMIIVELTELANRMESLSATEYLEGFDLESLQILAGAASAALQEMFEKSINQKLAFCALYCDPLRLNHIEHLQHFCTIEEVRNAVFLELENLDSSKKPDEGQQPSPWLSYTEEAQQYEQLTIKDVLDAMEAIGLDRNPQHYSPLAFWRIYESVYPSIARLARQVLAVSASLANAASSFEHFKPLEHSLSKQFDLPQISRLIRLYSIHQQKDLQKSRQGAVTADEARTTRKEPLAVRLSERIREERKRSKRKVPTVEEEDVDADQVEEYVLTHQKKRGRGGAAPKKRTTKNSREEMKREERGESEEIVDVVK